MPTKFNIQIEEDREFPFKIIISVESGNDYDAAAFRATKNELTEIKHHISLALALNDLFLQ